MQISVASGVGLCAIGDGFILRASAYVNIAVRSIHTQCIYEDATLQ